MTRPDHLKDPLTAFAADGGQLAGVRPPTGRSISRSSKITVIALCYNHARYVISCLSSINDQTYQGFQLIITDDASSDGSVALILEWITNHRPDTHFIRHDRNRGLCATLNEAIAAANGDLISMVATDDLWHRDKLARQLDFASGLPDTTAVIYSDAEMIDEDGVRIGDSFIRAHRPGGPEPEGKIFSALADGNFVPAMSTLIRTTALKSVGGYDESLIYEDYDMWLRLSDSGFDFAFCPGKLAQYRVVRTSMTNTLFVRPTANFSYTVFRLHEHWLSTDKLSKQQRMRFAAKVADAAYNLFLHEDFRAQACLWAATKHSKSIRMLGLAAACSLGITRSQGKRWLNRLGLAKD